MVHCNKLLTLHWRDWPWLQISKFTFSHTSKLCAYLESTPIHTITNIHTSTPAEMSLFIARKLFLQLELIFPGPKLIQKNVCKIDHQISMQRAYATIYEGQHYALFVCLFVWFPPFFLFPDLLFFQRHLRQFCYYHFFVLICFFLIPFPSHMLTLN